MCGGVVNESLTVKRCSEAEHGVLRRSQNKFCVDCGTQLIRSVL
jgi:hypothetical protein